MKTKRIALILSLALAAGIFSGCGESKAEEAAAPSSEAKTEAAAAETESEKTNESSSYMMGDTVVYKAADHVTLGDYEGLSVTIPSTEVSDEEVEAEMTRRLDAEARNSYRHVDKDTVEMGDIVNIDYEGKKDGVPFDKGSAEGYYLTIGSGRFIDGFETGLVGVKVGDTVDLNLTFPDSYTDPELAGADVVFTVKVNEIVEQDLRTLSDLDDDYVNEHFGASSVEVWKESVRADLEAAAETDAQQTKRNAVMEELRKICKVNSIPDGLIEERKAQAKEYYDVTAAAYGVDLETFLVNAYGMTTETLDAWIEENTPSDVEDELILVAIADEMGLDENSTEFKEYVDEIKTTNGFESDKDLYDIYDKNYMIRLFKRNTALDRVAEMANVTTEETTETESEETKD